jgi:hypothetical protein
MARPEPKALLDAAAAMRTDATNARRLVAQEIQRRDTDLGIAHDRALQRQSAAEQAVKTADDTRKAEHRDAQEFRATAEDYRKQADAAEQKGDTRAAEETREQVQRLEARAEAAEARAVQADRDYDDARVDLATRQREANALDQQMTDMNKASNVAERQLDALEDKARLLDEAGRKLGAASVTDNVVDRAQLELDAEKLLKNANGMMQPRDRTTTAPTRERRSPPPPMRPASRPLRPAPRTRWASTRSPPPRPRTPSRRRPRPSPRSTPSPPAPPNRRPTSLPHCLRTRRPATGSAPPQISRAVTSRAVTSRAVTFRAVIFPATSRVTGRPPPTMPASEQVYTSIRTGGKPGLRQG